MPPPHEAVPVPELLDTLFELLAAEPSAGVQAVLGHFLFVYIHPYSHGNGRLGRFILYTRQTHRGCFARREDKAIAGAVAHADFFACEGGSPELS